MPTNIADSSENLRALRIVCVWTFLGLMLTAFFVLGLPGEFGQALATAG